MDLNIKPFLVLAVFLMSSCSLFQSDEQICEEVFSNPDELPILIGGLASLHENIEYPQEAKENEIEGRVVVKFIVDTQGNVKEPEITRSLGYGTDEEVMKAIKSAKFKPATHNGETVCSEYSIPFIFKLQN